MEQPHSRGSGEEGGGRFHPVDGLLGYDGPLYRFLTHVVVAGLAVLAWPVLRLLFRVEVLHRERMKGLRPPFLVVSNHQSLLDSHFLCILAGLRPSFLLRSRFLPFHTPEEANFMASRLGKAVHLALRCVPIRRGAGLYQPGIETVITLLRRGGVVFMFPEGTRSRTGAIGKGTPGVGRVILEARCPVLPFRIEGMDRVLPVGSRWPRPFQRVRFVVGELLPPSVFADLRNDLRGWHAAAQRVIEAIRTAEEGAAWFGQGSRVTSPAPGGPGQGIRHPGR